MSEQVHSILAEFKDPGALLKAASDTLKAGYKSFETYSPFPIHGMDDAMGLGASKLPWIVLCCGALGASGGFALQTWVATSAYRLTISGKPFFSYQAFVPVTFELMVLLSAFGAVFGMFALNKLPQLYSALFKSQNFSKATSHGFFLEIQAQDPKFNEATTAEFLKSIGGIQIEVIKD
jgi:hypothetical protein